MWERFRISRHNLVAGWEEDAFRWGFVKTRFLGRDVFLCNSPESVQFAFSTANASFERKSLAMRASLRPLIGDGLFISEGATWKSRRRTVAPIVHVSQLKQFAPLMVEAAEEMAAQWLALPAGEPVDVLHEMARLTADIICRTIFGGSLSREDTREIAEGFTDYQKAVDVFDIGVLLNHEGLAMRRPNRRIREAAARIVAVLERVLEGARARAAQGEVSLIGRLLDARDEETGEPLDATALRNEAAVLFMAGYETTASTLAWCWYILSQSARNRARLHAELDQVLPDGRAPTLADLSQLPFTRLFIEETLRLYSPIPFLSREALAEETFQGQRVAAGSALVVMPWLLHRHKDHWVDPDTFRPMRFAEGPAPSKFAYLPFSVGPRVCPGLSFGLTEAILCLATLASRCDLHLVPGHVVEPVCHMTLRPGYTLPMTATARR